ncbi:Twitching mobility protein [Aquicella siphonis]|uniref:Twitching mobility protein n=1 Tax=Aquicella siphonis TaxID=254247 RepID=A0A5E4PF52_9COXI|nr:PilT/PilU family type 4a pilus ATPase [Aquicella siphonis]VVC74956.1 Twitching mobility protein [Aquicella siphonis]
MEMAELLQLSIKHHASDLHMLPGLSPLMRIDGELLPAKEIQPLSPDEVKALIYSVMTKNQQERFEKELQCEVAVSLETIGNFRVSVYHQLRGIAAVFRIIPEKVPTFEELSLPSVLKSLLVLSNGLILVTGPAGSGKSTTLAAMIDYINTLRACNIITIEDPIEFIHTSKKSAISQLQVHRDTPQFAAALRASLRQDPNVILLGELRDLETIRLALTAAETGHLVMATLHATSAPLAVNRIVDVFPNAEKNRVRDLLSETIQGICCQTLVKKLSGGRMAAFEIMLATRAIRHQIRQDKIAHMLMTMQTNGDIGMCTMEQYLDDLVAKRLISQNVARNVSLNRGSSRY